ncbi:TIGR04283 family arsenosugar biosynthesis glycosyltransferase [Albimonas sp. CAU 1670]|uniref:TIGR04283 family arsenosugar biosynthesis glycosyltransferase n=1 Tax=Albimonas sp. CAU 1670 TaxID=3032599 RepID=UPI0023DC71FB|nr:TIGR04283 family arsenosugar biosynthesis glycosyltransferase [Albimonas sp. CAU 1670]MDF2233444.1 TIGR04283 family arsenosugar biosynthesis glycosyltransferase [Albimonas sp. CAU 1670]
MAAPLSIVIPTLDAVEEIGPCLGALATALTEGLIREVILSDGGSRDAIAEVADAAGAVLMTGPAGRGGQLARGAQAAKGEWLLFLHADTVLSPGWSAAVRRHMEERPDRAGWFRLRFDEPGTPAALVAAWANFRARRLGLPYGDQGLLVRAADYRRAGGYPDQPLMEDVSLARRLPLAPLAAEAVTSARRYRAEGWLRRGWRNLTTLGLYFLGADPERLARRYAR